MTNPALLIAGGIIGMLLGVYGYTPFTPKTDNDGHSSIAYEEVKVTSKFEVSQTGERYQIHCNSVSPHFVIAHRFTNYGTTIFLALPMTDAQFKNLCSEQ